MRWVEVAAGKPHRCAAIPFVGPNDPEGYIHTGSVMDGWDNEVYISVKAVRGFLETLEWPKPEDYTRLAAYAKELEAQLTETVRERDELQQRFEAIDVLASADFRARNKPGRPRTKKPEDEKAVAA